MTQILSSREKIDELRQRVIALRPNLPENFKGILTSKHPDYDKLKVGDMLSNLLHLKSLSGQEPLIIILEEIAAEHKAKKELEPVNVEKK